MPEKVVFAGRAGAATRARVGLKDRKGPEVSLFGGLAVVLTHVTLFMENIMVILRLLAREVLGYTIILGASWYVHGK